MLDMSLDKFLDYVKIKTKDGKIIPIKQYLSKSQIELLKAIEQLRIKKNSINRKTN